jgi:hypothetical protein
MFTAATSSQCVFLTTLDVAFLMRWLGENAVLYSFRECVHYGTYRWLKVPERQDSIATLQPSGILTAVDGCHKAY